MLSAKKSIGTGLWLDMIQGKKVLSQIIHSDCFKAQAADGTFLNGKKKLKAVIKDLLHKDKKLPPDFTELKRLIREHC